MYNTGTRPEGGGVGVVVEGVSREYNVTICVVKRCVLYRVLVLFGYILVRLCFIVLGYGFRRSSQGCLKYTHTAGRVYYGEWVVRRVRWQGVSNVVC